ncbi:hypothetical protein [endosymbiont GvMRE of Glomus versiforme]|uniref:hypothetical protein n=1 Tax=endosymbiont GvMRE of Glomus versiforme TaxID=2039283 RepID=UPI0011C4A8AD|nr:hypothetical protein [endosymbiont GvMRE of Glomus versiforme]
MLNTNKVTNSVFANFIISLRPLKRNKIASVIAVAQYQSEIVFFVFSLLRNQEQIRHVRESNVNTIEKVICSILNYFLIIIRVFSWTLS